MTKRRSPGLAIALAIVLSLGVAAILPAPAAAQVTVNPGALDLLPTQPSRPARQAPERHTPERHTRERHAPAHAAPTAQAPPTAAPSTLPPPTAAQPSAARPSAAQPNAARPAIPATPPAIAALPPPPPIPAPRVEPVTVPAIGADAPGTATPIPGGLRLTFGPGRQDLNADSDAALRTLARSLRAGTDSINVLAYAAGTPDDLSTARRLSLARALTVRAVLINEGIASSRIYPRAMGPAAGNTDQDRVDITAGPPSPPSPPTVK